MDGNPEKSNGNGKTKNIKTLKNFKNRFKALKF